MSDYFVGVIIGALPPLLILAFMMFYTPRRMRQLEVIALALRRAIAVEASKNNELTAEVERLTNEAIAVNKLPDEWQALEDKHGADWLRANECIDQLRERLSMGEKK